MSHTASLDAEKQTENSASAVSEPSSAPINCAQDAEKIKKTAGHKIHNEITYRGIDWLLNSAVGVASTMWTDRSEMGKKWFSEPVTKGFEVILKPFLKNPAQLKEGATWGRRFSSIMVGGFTIIPVMMFMENKKVKKDVVRWLDEKVYGEDEVKKNPDFQACYDAIDKEPDKKFGAGIVSRFIAIAPLITAASIPASNMWLMKHLYNPIGNFSKRCASKLGIKPKSKWWAEGAMEHIDGNPKTPKQFQNNWEFLHTTIGFDFGLTIAYAILHEMSYKALAAIGMKKDDTSKLADSDMLRRGGAVNDFSNEFRELESALSTRSSHADRVKKIEHASVEPQSHSHTQRVLQSQSADLMPQL